MTYSGDRKWADKHIEQVAAILRANAMHIVKIEVAPETQDAEEATDLIIEVKGGSVAVRLRRVDTHYRDLTIRSRRPSGVPTELYKLRAGFGDWYLYGWTNNGNIEEWILVDLNLLRGAGLLEGPRAEIPNRDGSSHFVAISLNELGLNGCLAAFHLLPDTLKEYRINTNTQIPLPL